MTDALQAPIAAGIEAMGLDLAAGSDARLARYLELLARWNRAYNLTAVRDPGQMVIRHVLESLAVLPHLEGERVLDVGTGAGVPGLVLALADPARHYVLLDSNGKKIRFLRHAVATLGAANVEVVAARMETYAPAAVFPTILARAVAALEVLLEATAAVRAPGGVLLVMKATLAAAEERAAARWDCAVERVPLAVPGAERPAGLCIVRSRGRRAGTVP